MAIKTKYATVCGMEFGADTVALAKAYGEKQIATLAEEANRGPMLYDVHGLNVLVFPQLNGWSYQILKAGHRGLVQGSCSMGGSRYQAVIAAISHAAQNQWSHDVADDTAFYTEAFAGLSPWHVDQAIADGVYWASWHRRWKVAFEVCGDRNAAHDIATRTRTVDETRNLAKRETVIAA